MKLKVTAFILFSFFFSVDTFAENNYSPKVPSEINFAGMSLKLTDGLRREIQREVDLLTQSPTYFNIKADRARAYFPIMEKALKAEGIPSDFKYLSLQESGLISDVVSSANAVGYWQFKDFTGREVGLRVDRSVDERMNVVASTHGAAKYFKRHNFYFDNWLYCILAHMTGRGGAMKYVDKSKFGAKRMHLDKNTHWYVRRYLAHKIAFEGVTGPHSKGLKLIEYKKGKGKTLAHIAKELKVDETELKRYNKWLRTSKVPGEKTYVVIVPVVGKSPKIKGIEEKPSDNPDSPGGSDDVIFEKTFAKVSGGLNKDGTIFIKINGLPCILAKAGDGIGVLAEKGQISPEKFARNNDILPNAGLVEGEVYYLKRKRKKGLTYYHTVQQGETLWSVSQKFGVRVKELAKLNRMMSIDELVPGRVLWLRKKRPVHIPVEIKELYEGTTVEVLDDFSKLPPAPLDVPIGAVSKTEEDTVKQKVVKEVINRVDTSSMVQPDVIEEKAAVPSVKPLEEVQDSSLTLIHRVAKGETLYSIARNSNVSITDLMKWNNMLDPGISIDQELILQGGEALAQSVQERAAVSIHVVEPGDTMYGISKKYDVPVEDILRINQKENFDLSVGEKVKLKD